MTHIVLPDQLVVLLHIEQNIEEVRLRGHGIECPGIISTPGEGLFGRTGVHLS